MTVKRKQGSADAALFLALFLVVQAMLAGLATGARADIAASPFDVICGSAGLIHDGQGENGGGAGHQPDCCSFGCPMVGGALPPPALPTLGLARATLIASIEAEPAGTAEKRAELSPVLSRAPPAV